MAGLSSKRRRDAGVKKALSGTLIQANLRYNTKHNVVWLPIPSTSGCILFHSHPSYSFVCFLVYLKVKINFIITLVADDGTDDGDDDSDRGSVGRQDGQNAGRKLSAKTIKAILELICDEAVSFSSSSANLS